MDKPISRLMHGLLTDYPYVALVSTAPQTVGFREETTAVTMTKVLSGGILLSSLVTRAEWGLLRVMPYKAHLAADVAGGVLAASAPWLFGFARNKRARNTFLVAGAFGIMAGLLSKTNEMPRKKVSKKRS